MTSIREDAAFTVNELKKADQNDDFSSVFQELEKDFKAYDKGQFQEYLKNVNEILTRDKILPTVAIEGVNPDRHEINVRINGKEMTLNKDSAVARLDRRTLEANVSRNLSSENLTISRQLPDGRALHFDEQGRVKEIITPNGKISYKRDADGGVVEAVTTDKNGKVVQTDKLEGGKWVSYDQSGKKKAETDGVKSVDIDKNGDHVMKTADGTLIQKLKDNSIIKLDASGKVTEVKYADGSKREFAYDKDGKLSEVKFDDGKGFKDSWKKEGSVWQNYDKDGKPTSRKLDHVSVEKNGTVHERDSSGERVINTDSRLHNAERTVLKPDGSRVTTDANGRVTEVEMKNGSKRQFEYDKSGNLSKMVYTDKDGKVGWTYEKEGDKWQSKKPDGTPIGKPVEMDARVLKDGTLDVTFPALEKWTARTDGSIVSTNKEGQITNIVYIDGTQREFKYDKDGKLSEVKYKNTAGFEDSWKREGDAWVNYDKDGNKTGKTLGGISLDKDGTLVEHDRNKNEGRVMKTDGSTELRKVSPDSETEDIGKPAPPERRKPEPETRKPAESWHEKRQRARESQKDEIDCTGARVVQAGDTLWDIARANLELHSKDGKAPSNQQIMAEVRRLARVNKIKDVSNIPVGSEIKMESK